MSMIFLDIQEFDVSPVIPSTLVGLLGLIAGYVYYYLRQKNKNELEKIKELKEEDRPKYLEQKLNDFGTSIDTTDLAPDHKYDLLKRLMNNKIKKYSISAVTLVALALVVYLVWGKKQQDSLLENQTIEINSFSFASGDASFDSKMIEGLEGESFIHSVNNPTYKILLISEPPEKPFHRNGSVDRIDYYYNAVPLSFEINDVIHSSTVLVPKTEMSPHIPEAEEMYMNNYYLTINDNFETIYEEILRVIMSN